MALGLKKLGLQARFMVLAGAGVLAMASITLAVIAWVEYANVEEKLRSFSDNELRSLSSLLESVMEHRLADPNNVAIAVFNGWFESRNKDYPGELWTAWSPKVAAYVVKNEPGRPPKPVRDSVDEEAMRTYSTDLLAGYAAEEPGIDETGAWEPGETRIREMERDECAREVERLGILVMVELAEMHHVVVRDPPAW